VDFKLNDDQLAIQKMTRDFAKKEIAPQAEKLDREGLYPREIFAKLAELGFFGMVVPEEYGGLGLDAVSYNTVLEEIARACASVTVVLAVHNSVACWPILAFGSEETKKQYLPRMASGEHIGAFALTEPHCGSDASALRTTAVRDGDHYILNGQKTFITSGANGHVFIVMAKTDTKRGGHRGISTFVVESSFEGFAVGKHEDKMGMRASDTTELFFEDCRVPAQNLLGDEGMGFRVAMASLDGSRIGVAAQALGIAQAALDEAVAYAQERKAFGKTLGRHGVIADKLASMRIWVETSRLLVQKAAWLHDQGQPFGDVAAMAKFWAADCASRVCDEAVQIFGGYGYIKDFPVERYYRDARVTRIYEGAAEIQKIVIARSMLGGR